MVLTDNYSVSFRTLGDSIFISIPVGNCENGGMERFLEIREEFLRSRDLYRREHVELKDYSGTPGKVSRNDRMIFTKYILAEKERGFLLGLFGYNGLPLVRWSFEIGRRLYSKNFPLQFCRDYDQALTAALEVLERKQNSRNAEDLSHEEENREIEKLFYHISSLNWDLNHQEVDDISLDENNPYSKIYKALALLKSDFDNILEEQKKTEKAIEKKVQERTVLLREERAKLETSLDLLSHDTKNHFISLKFETDQIEDSKLKNSIGESVREIQELIGEATGIMSSRKRIVSIDELLENIKVTSKRIALTAHDRIRVHLDSPEFLFVHTTALFKNAVSNLIENALKYTGEGNIVKVQVDKDDRINIRIIDYGNGIPDGEKEKILEKFYRREVTASIEGSGRGLWITNNIITQEGGTLSITDNPEGGAVFTISLPPYRVGDFEEMVKELSLWFELPRDIVKSRAEAYRTLFTLQDRKDIDHMDSAVITTLLTEIRRERKEEKKASVKQKLELLRNRNPGGKTAIIADDSLYVQYYLARYLTELGIDVKSYADNGESAFIAYEKNRPDFITLDNNMNVMTGVEAAEMIYGIDRDCRIIFISALGDSEVFRGSVKNKIPAANFRILTKPIYRKDVEKILGDFFQ